MTTIETQTFAEILATARTAYESAEDANEAYYNCVWALAHRGDQATLDQLLPLTQGDVFERDFSVAALGPFDCGAEYDKDGKRERLGSRQVIDLLLEMVEKETDEGVLVELMSSLGEHQENDDRIPLALQRFVDHPSASIRWALARGMGKYDSPESISMLLQLSKDSETEVRDWATFELGSIISTDSLEIRAALWARINDEDPDTRVEAIVGLAMRRDPKVLPVIRREYDEDLTPEQPYIPNRNLTEALQEWAEATGDEDVKATIAFCEEVIEDFSD